MKAFIEPEAEVVEFNENDAIVASGSCPDNCRSGFCLNNCKDVCNWDCPAVGSISLLG